MKTCTRCLRSMLRDCFNRCAKAKDGRQSYCRDCKRTFARQAYHKASPEQKERMLERKKKDGSRYREKHAESQKTWLRANRARTRRYDAKRRKTEARKAYMAAYWKTWKAENPELAREYARRGQQVRRARKLGAFVEDVDYAVVFARDKGICGICREAVDPVNWHLDHIRPLALGGAHSYANVRVSHPFCNISRSRGTRDEKARLLVAT